ncbi:MAG: hypothetical protein KGN76_14140 [Acidobacteriota bacterium]|nr:hypothetical protein [Acidobacteriota bacterium]
MAVRLVRRYRLNALAAVALLLLAGPAAAPAAGQSVPPIEPPAVLAPVAAPSDSAPTLRRYVPMTPSGRWDQYWRATFLSPGAYFRALGAAAGGQFANDPAEWGQGATGYARRTASTFARFTLSDTIRASTAAALGYDTRYLRCGCDGGWQRLGHALKMTVLTADAQGRMRVDIPAVTAAYGSAAIAAAWLPGPARPVHDGLRDGSIRIGVQAGVNLLREFGPELRAVFGGR